LNKNPCRRAGYIDAQQISSFQTQTAGPDYCGIIALTVQVTVNPRT
jgi:hypothetical protein